AGNSLYASVNSTSQTLSVTYTPTLIVNPISPYTTLNRSVASKLTSNSSGAGLGGKTITFSGTGAANLQPVTTNPDGTFSVTGASPNTVNNNWQVNANFAGDTSYANSVASQYYSTLQHTTF